MGTAEQHIAPPEVAESDPATIRAINTGVVIVAAGIAALMVGVLLRDRAIGLRPGTMILSGVLLLLAGACVSAVRVSLPRKGAIVAGVIAGVLMMYMLEFSLAVMQRLSRDRLSIAGQDVRTKAEVVAGLRRAGTRAVPSINPITIGELKGGERRLFALSGVSNSFTVMCSESPDWAMYDSDERGFNNPRGIWGLPGIDVVAIGDSFVQGWCVPEDSNLVAGIRKRYPATLNLGMGGNGPLIGTALFREYVQRLRPRLVLWIYFENDLLDLEYEKTVPLIAGYRDPAFEQGLFDRQKEVDERLAELFERSQLAGSSKRLRDVPAIRRTIDFVSFTKTNALLTRVIGVRNGTVGVCCDLQLYRSLLSRADSATTSWGGELFFVFLPARERYRRDPLFRASADELAARDELLATVRELGIPIVDVHQAFKAHGRPLELFPDPLAHYNAAGYKLAAEYVLQELDRLGAAPAPGGSTP